MTSFARLVFLPLPVSMLLALSGIALLLQPPRRCARAARTVGSVLALGGLLLLWLCSTPFVSTRLMERLELSEPLRAVRDAPQADAIVALSFGRSVIPADPASLDQVSHCDRMLGAVRLFLAGKAPRIVFTGESVHPQAANEGVANRHLAMSFGVPEDAIFTTSDAANTIQEAREVRRTLDGISKAQGLAHRVLLVTSAFHMRRARAAFEAEGFLVIPFPVGSQVISSNTPSSSNVPTFRSLIPSAGALAQTELAIREFVGRAWLPAPSVPVPP